MNIYHINVAPTTGIGIGFVGIGETENHALAELSLSLRQSIKIFKAHIDVGHPSNREIFTRKLERNLEILRIIRKPGRFALQKDNFYAPRSWPKVTVTEITRSITASYVKEVWLGN
jgi:preprotein translocase subunit Sss1